MSDSDDTDILLLVPPGIFIDSIERDLELNSLQTEVVGNLISQVSELENRVTLIESVNNSSCGNESMVFNDCDATGQSSVINTEELVHNRDLVSPSFSLNACDINSNTESSIDLHHSGHCSSSKSKEELLKDIDSYLSNLSLKHSKEGREDQNYETSSNSVDKSSHIMADDVSIRHTPPFKSLDLPEVDKLLKEMEATQTEIENKLRLREVEYGLNGQKNAHNISYRQSFPPTDNISSHERNSVPYAAPFQSPLKIHELDRQLSNDSFLKKRDSYLVGSSHNSDSDDTRKNSIDFSNVGLRELKPSSSFDNKKRFVSPRRRLFTQTDSSLGRKPASGKSTSSSTNFGLSHQTKDYLSNLASGDNSFIRSNTRGTDVNTQRDKPPPKYNRNDLLSLAELWKSERDLTEDDSKKLRQKLEEEKIRRIHLENTIQDLQRRVLEEQEKLAVAVKVDEGKDRAIGQITEAWKQMVNHWREIEADRHAMSQSIIKERASIKQTQEEINKKIERSEKEVSQALDLAAGYKSKCEFLEKELSTTIEAHDEKIIEVETKLKSTEEELLKINDERKELTDKLKLSEDDHNKEKQLVELAQKELSTLQETFRKTEAELIITKEQRELLTTRLREEKGRSSILDHQKMALQDTLEETKEKLIEAEDTIKKFATNLEKEKSELRAVYQNQLEIVVKQKHEEFQSQLDKAQAVMKAELTEARRLSQERAAGQQRALVNSHIIELRRLEAMYKADVKSLEAKLTESERRRDKLESGKKEIAHKLHGVMEAQWQQALSIITSEISLRQGESEVNKIGNGVLNDSKSFNIDSVDLGTSVDEPAVSKDVLQSNQNFSQDGLSKYIHMLLDKRPGKPIDSGSSGIWPEVTQSGDTMEESLTDQRWNQVLPSTLQTLNEHLKPVPKSNRKPWK